MALEWISVGHVNDVPYLGSRVIKTSGVDIAVFKNSHGKIFALEDKCPHLGGPLSQGIVHGTSVSCPLHNWDISLESGAAKAPDKGCAHAIPVDLRDGQIYLSLKVERTGTDG